MARLGPAASARYRLHETMREYALSSCATRRRSPQRSRPSSSFYASICQAAERRRTHLSSSNGCKRIDGEARQRTRCARSLPPRPGSPTGLSMVGSLLWYWTARATSEGMYWLDLYLDVETAKGRRSERWRTPFSPGVCGDGARRTRRRHRRLLRTPSAKHATWVTCRCSPGSSRSFREGPRHERRP